MRRISTLALVFLLSFSFALAMPAYETDFDTGSFVDTSEWTWTTSQATSVSNLHSRSGNHALRFYYPAEAPNAPNDCTPSNVLSEQRFALGTPTGEVWLEYYMYYPDGNDGFNKYEQRSIQGCLPKNNKFFRIWGNTRGECGMVGSSTWSASGDNVWGGEHFQWTGTNHIAMGQGGLQTAPYIDDSLRGRWIQVRQHYKLGTGNNDREIELWVDGQQISSTTGIANNNAACTGYWDAGYILGSANSGFTENTNIFIDDLKYYNTDPNWGSVPTTYPNKPTGMTDVFTADGSVISSGGDAFGINYFSAPNVGAYTTQIADATNPGGSGEVIRIGYSGEGDALIATANGDLGGPWDEAYWMTRLYFENATSDWNTGTGSKIFYFGHPPDHTTCWWIEWQTDGSIRVVSNNCGATNNFPNAYSVQAAGQWTTDTWLNIEMHTVKETAPGAADGKLFVWVDNNIVINRSDVPWSGYASTQQFGGVEWYSPNGAPAYNVGEYSYVRLGEWHMAGKNAPPPPLPGQPGAPVFSMNGNNVDVSWPAGTGATSYRYTSGSNNGSWPGQNGNLTGTSLTLSGPAPAEGIWFCVWSQNSAGESTSNACNSYTIPGCQNGAVQSCGSNVGVCQEGSQFCSGGVWGACIGGVSPSVEICTDTFDNDCDGTVNEGCSGGLPGDYNTDGIINFQDLVNILSKLGRNGMLGDPADADGDGDVDLFDLVLVARSWQRPSSASISIGQVTNQLQVQVNATCPAESGWCQVRRVSPSPHVMIGEGANNNPTFYDNNVQAGTQYTYNVRYWDANWGAESLHAESSITVQAVSPTDTTPPVISNPQPSGQQPSGTSQVAMTLDTDETAECRYHTSDTNFASMTNTFSSTNAQAHSQQITGLSDGDSRTYYIRCQDTAGNSNTASTTINFNIATSGGSFLAFSDFSSGTIAPYTNPWAADVSVIADPTGSNMGNVVQIAYTPTTSPSVDRAITYLPSAMRYGQTIWLTADVYFPSQTGNYNHVHNRKLFDYQASVSGGPRMTLHRRGNYDLRFSVVDSMSGAEAETVAESTGIVLPDDQWHRMEIRMTTNSADNVRDGILEIYLNGEATPSYSKTTGIGWITDQVSPGTFFDTFHVGRQLTVDSGDPYYTDYRYFDNVGYSSTRNSLGPLPTGSSGPVISNLQPSTTLPAGTTQVTISLDTDVTAECKYHTTDKPFDAPGTSVFASTDSTTHSQTLTGLVDGMILTYYVRCEDTSGNSNTAGTVLSFDVGFPGGDTRPPVMKITSPTGGLGLKAGTTSETLIVTTDENANCRYANVETSWNSMSPMSTTGGLVHSQPITGLTDGSAYNYYVHCEDAAGNKHNGGQAAWAAAVHFSVANPMPTTLFQNMPSGMTVVTNYSFDDVPDPVDTTQFQPVDIAQWLNWANSGWRSNYWNPGIGGQHLTDQVQRVAMTTPSGDGFAHNLTYPPDACGTGPAATVYTTVGNANEMYISWVVRWDADFQHHGTSEKLLQIDKGAPSYHLWQLHDGAEKLHNLGGGGGTWGADLMPPTRWGGRAAFPAHDQWMEYEFYGNAATNTFRWWLNGELRGDHSDVTTIGPFNVIELGGTWGGCQATSAQPYCQWGDIPSPCYCQRKGLDGPCQYQSRYTDHVLIATR